MQGDSMASWCLKGEGRENEAVYFSASGWRAVWDGRYIFSPVGNYDVLYDHQEDPYETTNLMDSAEHGDVRARMCGLLVEFAEETGDPELANIRAVCQT
ncbi:MAG: hypothetical protein ACYS8Z_23670, partial [Planctomycetota bacterium]|jgi:arylsulfatase A-like enzyme